MPDDQGLSAPERSAAEYGRLVERLAALAQAAGLARDVAGICRAVLEFACASAPCSGLFVSRYDAARQQRTAVFAWSEGQEVDVTTLPPLPMTASPNSRSVQTGQVIVTDDLQAAISGQPRVDVAMDVDPNPPRSSVAVPLIVQGRVIGGFEAQSTRPAAFGPDHVSALRLAANLAAIALENLDLLERERELNAGLERRVQERTRELEAERGFLAALLSSLSDGIVAADAGGRLSLFNDAAREFHGLDAEPLDAAGWAGRYGLFRADGITPLPADEVPLTRALRGERVRDAEMVIAPEGRPARSVVATGDRIVGPGGELLGAVVAMRDVTDRRRAERALRQALAELEARNAEQETFVYTVSHDLRAPLLSLHGMSELLEEAVERANTSEAAYLLGRVRSNVTRMGALLNDLLVLSRAGAEVGAPEVLDLGTVVSGVAAELEPRLRERAVHLELPVAWPRVLYPPSAAYQLIANLVGNAAKFAGSRVRLSWEPDKDLVVVRVSDDGPGVRPEYRERVFGLFQKLDAKAEGTGVGLAIVRRIAERHGGRVWLEQDADLGGAAFAVTLPAAP